MGRPFLRYVASNNAKTYLDFWHSDKAPYQKDLAEKITKLFTQIGQIHGV